MSVSQADGYAEGLSCEHNYLIGPPCGEAAAWLFRGVARCPDHFDAFVTSHAIKYHVDIRLEAQEL